jgi:hypothetical protein
MKKVIAYSLALFIALVGFQMGATKAFASVKAPSISKLSDEPAPMPAPEKKAGKKKHKKKKS